MILIYSDNTLFFRRCVDLLSMQDKVTKWQGNLKLIHEDVSDRDLLMIGLERDNEKKLPQIACPSMVLVNRPVYEQAVRLFKVGVRGYGNIHMRRENFIQAVSIVRAGQVWLPPMIINQMITSLPRATVREDPVLSEPLSKREEEVVQWLVKGLSNREIGEKMFVSIRTVKAHLTSIFRKTHCRDRLELAVKMKHA